MRNDLGEDLLTLYDLLKSTPAGLSTTEIAERLGWTRARVLRVWNVLQSQSDPDGAWLDHYLGNRIKHRFVTGPDEIYRVFDAGWMRHRKTIMRIFETKDIPTTDELLAGAPMPDLEHIMETRWHRRLRGL
jgi:hypothetical protein